jgi:hypothetical protein
MQFNNKKMMNMRMSKIKEELIEIKCELNLLSKKLEEFINYANSRLDLIEHMMPASTPKKLEKVKGPVEKIKKAKKKQATQTTKNKKE